MRFNEHKEMNKRMSIDRKLLADLAKEVGLNALGTWRPLLAQGSIGSLSLAAILERLVGILAPIQAAL